MITIAIRLLATVFTALATGCLHVPPAPLNPADSARSLEARSLSDPALQTFLTERFGRPRDPWPRARWGVEELTLAAIYFHPSLLLARAQLERAEAHEGRAAQRPNPSVMLMPQYVSPASGHSPWAATFQLNWTIETGGKRDERRAVALAGTRVAAANLESAAWLLRGELTQALFTFRAARARSAHRQRSIELLSERLALVERRRQLGAGTASDVAREQVAQSRAAADRATSARLEGDARARLAAALGLPRPALDDLEVEDEADGAWTFAADLDSAAARDTALQGRSDILAALADYDAAEANLRLELALQYPNLVLGPGYQYQQGTHKWGLALTLDLPLMSRNEGAIEEARAARSEAVARFEALQARVMSEVDVAGGSLEAAQRERLQAREARRAADESASLAARALAAGATDRATWLAAELAADQSKLVEIDAEEQVELGRARLEAAIRPLGSKLEAAVESIRLGSRGAPESADAN